MRRGVKYSLFGVVIFFGLIALVIVLAMTSPVQTMIARRFLKGINDKMVGHLEFDRVCATLKGKLVIDGFAIYDSTGRPLLTAKKLTTLVNLAEIKVKRLHIRDLDIDGFTLTLEFDSTGTNIEKALAPRHPIAPSPMDTTAPPNPWVVRLDSATIRGGRTTVSLNDTFLFQTDEFTLKTTARYAHDSLNYRLGMEVPQQFVLNTDGELFLGKPFTPMLGHVTLTADTAFIATLPLPASTIGAADLKLDYMSRADSLILSMDFRGSKFGRVTLHGASPFPFTEFAMRGTMTFDSLTPGAIWSDTTGMMLSGNVEFNKVATRSPFEGWDALVKLRSSRYGPYRVASANLRLRSHDSTITLNGHLDTGDGRAEITTVVHGLLPADPSISTTVKLEEFNFHRLIPQIPDTLLPITGIITAHANITSTTIDLKNLNADLNTELGKVTFGAYSVDSLILQGRIRGQQFELDTVKILRDSLWVGMNASGKLGGEMEYAVAGAIPSLKDLKRILPASMGLPDTLGGSVTFDLSGTGNLGGNKPHGFTAAGQLRVDSAVYGADTVKSVFVSMDSLNIDSMALHGRIEVRGLKARGQKADSIWLVVNGTPTNVNAGIQLWARSDTVVLAGGFGLVRSKDRMDLRIDSLLGRVQDITFNTIGENAVSLSGKRLDVTGLTVNSSVGILRAVGTLQKGGQEDFTLELSGVQSEPIARLLKLPPTKSTINLRAQILGPDNDLTGTVDLIADTISMNDQPVADQFTLHATVDARHALVDGQMNWLGDTTLIYNAELPAQFAIDKGLVISKTDSIRGRMQLLKQRMDKFNRYLSNSIKIGGFISADMALRGTMEKPDWGGTFAVENGEYRDPRQGIRYRNITINGVLAGDTLTIPHFDIKSGGRLTGSGWAVMAVPLPSQLSLDLNFHNFEALNGPNMRARVSGPLKVSGPLNRLDATGNLEINKGLYRLTAATTKQIEPIDVKTELANLGGDTSKSSIGPEKVYQSMAHNISVYIPGNVWIKGNGLNVSLSGNLKLMKDRNQSPTLSGEIDVDRGTVTFYGQEFQVEEGLSTIRFDGPPDNPSLDITATVPHLAEQGVDITVRVYGTLKRMQLALSGTSADSSAMSTTQIAEAFVGMGGTRQSSSDQSASGRIEQAATGQATGQLAGFLGRAAGLDVLRYRPGEQSGLAGLTSGSLEVGTYLTGRLFVRVLQPLQATTIGQEVSVEYRLFRWLSLRIQQTSGSSSSQSGASSSSFDLLTRKDWR